MRAKKNPSNGSAEKTVKAIRRATRRQYAAEEKIRMVLEGTVRLTDSILRNRCLRTGRLAVGSTGTKRRLGVV